MKVMRLRLILVALAFLTFGVWLGWYLGSARRTAHETAAVPSNGSAAQGSTSQNGRVPSPNAPTNVSAHNLMLRKGPSFRVYVRWLRGRMQRSHPNVDPSFDDPNSFYLDIDNGVLRANIGDIANYLNAGGLGKAPINNVTLSGNGDKIQLRGTLHKIIPLPFEVSAQISALPNSRIRVHVTKIDLLKIPFKALLGGFHVTMSDLVGSSNIPGLQISGNDLFLDTQNLLPPPHIRGRLTAVRVVNPDLEAVYGNAQKDVTRVEQWRNFLWLEGGAIDFGRLTMDPVDLIMIDVSSDAWFDLDLAHYQKQLVYGYTRMTPQAGLQIFMPDLDEIPQNKITDNISMDWIKNRRLPVPSSVKKH